MNTLYIFLMCSRFIGNGTLWMREKVPSSSIAERRMSYTPKEENTQGWVSTRSYSNSFGHTMFYLLQCIIFILVQRHLAVSFSYPKCWHDISNTNIYIQVIHIPKVYILPTLCPKGTLKLSNLHSSPKCWHDISNTNIYFQLTHTPQIVGSIYPI